MITILPVKGVSVFVFAFVSVTHVKVTLGTEDTQRASAHHRHVIRVLLSQPIKKRAMLARYCFRGGAKLLHL